MSGWVTIRGIPRARGVELCVALGLAVIAGICVAQASAQDGVFGPPPPGGGAPPPFPFPPPEPVPPGTSTLPPVYAPIANPVTEPKRVLGKILFWDEQLAADDTVACGTCHLPETGGADPRLVRTPGADGQLDTKDDVFGSPGVVRQLADGTYARSSSRGFAPQVTPRVAPTVIGAQFSRELLADGRATAEFRDPLTGGVVSSQFAALESQAVAPPLSSVEMAHADRDWSQVAGKLERVKPLRLATDLPADVAAALGGSPPPSYPELFAAAFGDRAITPVRIARAIATYERTLVADQAPVDRFVRGDPTALTNAEQTGLFLFSAFGCANCHTPPLFTSDAFRNIGVRPPEQDRGRQDVTGRFEDRGRMKVPTLRNVGLRTRFMHDGKFQTLDQVLHFYGRDSGFVQFTDNQDPLMQLTDVPTQYQQFIKDFLRDGLTDPRVAGRQFPFDRPTLYSERVPAGSRTVAPGRIGSGGRAPTMIALTPPCTATDTFRVGLGDARPGAQAWLASSLAPPVGGELPTADLLGPFTTGEVGEPVEGSATVFAPGLAGLAGPGDDLWLQWRVADPLAAGGLALSAVVKLTAFADASEEATDTERPMPVVEVPADALYVSRATLLVDWQARQRGDARDRLEVRGIADLSAVGSPEGALVTLSVGGLPLLHGAPLDAEGRISGQRFGWASVEFRVDPATGRYRLDVSRADLDGILGEGVFEGLEDVQLTTVAVALAIEGAGLSAPPRTGTYVASVRNTTGRTAARIRFSNTAALTGAFQVTDARLRAVGSERRGTRRDVFALRARLALPDAAPAALAGPVTLEIGDSPPLVLPRTALRTSADGTALSYRAASGAVPGLRRFACDPASGRLLLEMDAPLGVSAGAVPVTVTLGGRTATYRCSATFRTVDARD